MVEYEPGSGHTKNVFPQAPADKAGRPKFVIRDRETGKVAFQICAGTKANDMHGHGRGLDLSIQLANASDSPTVHDVLQIFDAKYRGCSSDCITHPEFSEFARWVELFNLREKTAGLRFDELKDFDANCLVTNGKPSTELDAERLRTSVTEIFQFHPGMPHDKRPTS